MHPQPPAPEAASIPRATIAFGATVATGAFLLFLVEPLMAKYILPWYGGTPAVWTTCMLFYQTFVLLGYAYAHGLSRWCPVRFQPIVHLALLGVALFLLPVTPSEAWRPASGASPVWSILLMLSACLGLPFALLAATSPLLQRWYAMVVPGAVPYRYFALSNAASFLALLAYPFLVEPLLSRGAQAVIWSWGMGVYVLLCGTAAVITLRLANRTAGPETPAPTASTPPSALWLGLPMAASVLLLAVTNKLCQEIAVVPFLWVCPLLLYLLSFVVAFDRPRWYSRPLFGGMFAAAVLIVAWLPFRPGDPPIGLSLVAHCALLFAACMLCHGELYRMRPAPERLTGYYLTIAGAGALGGVFVVLVAPALFSDYAELPIGVGVCGGLVASVWYREPRGFLAGGRRRWAWGLLGVFLLGRFISMK